MPVKSVIAKLRLTAAVTDLCGTRIRAGKPSRTDAKPAIAVERDLKEQVRGGSGPTGTYFAFLKVHCIGDDYGDAEDLSDAVEDAMGGWSQGSGPEISMTQVLDTEYGENPDKVEGADQQREIMVVNLQLDCK